MKKIRQRFSRRSKFLLAVGFGEQYSECTAICILFLQSFIACPLVVPTIPLPLIYNRKVTLTVQQ